MIMTWLPFHACPLSNIFINVFTSPPSRHTTSTWNWNLTIVAQRVTELESFRNGEIAPRPFTPHRMLERTANPIHQELRLRVDQDWEQERGVARPWL